MAESEFQANAVSSRITSTKNPLLQSVRKLLKRRYRDELGLVRIEGTREIDRALEAGIQFEYAIYCESLSRFERARKTVERLRSAGLQTLYSTTTEVFLKFSQWQNPDGLLVVGRQPSTKLHDIQSTVGDIYLVVDGVEKPGNLGSMLRTADATGCAAVIVTDPALDLFNPNVIRASLGTVFSKTCVVVSANDAAEWLRSSGCRIVATSPSASVSYLDTNLAGDCAMVIGSEKDGLTEFWLAASDELVKLPNLGAADSLNAAMSATALLFESYRQRQSPLTAS